MRKKYWLSETTLRMSCPSHSHPICLCRIVEIARDTRYNPILTKFDLGSCPAPYVRPNCLPIAWDKSVQIDKMRNALSDVLQSACDDKAAI